MTEPTSQDDAVFPHRGVIEGFYGPPWSPQDRLEVVERMGRWGLNRYVYAPKDDPLHRSRWRDPYPAHELSEFATLIERGAHAGVDVGFAISPGLSIEYSAAADRAALAGKLAPFAERGARFFCLALDDVPTQLAHAADRAAFADLGAAHVALSHDLAEALGPDCTLWLVPTDYTGVASSPYLETLGAGLDPRIEVGWTGRTVVSPEIRADEAERRAASLGRRLLLWDNVPVADGPMRPLLHLGPYVGRDPGLARHLSGVLLNPMQHPRASGVTLRSAADWLGDPSGYVADTSFEAAAREIGSGAGDAFFDFARAHRFSAAEPDDRDRELEAAWSDVRDAPNEKALAALRAQVDRRRAAAAALPDALDDSALGAEIAPWVASFDRELGRMHAALELLEKLAAGAPRLEQLLAFFRFEAILATPTPAEVSFGPRRVLYPQAVSLDSEQAELGDDPVVFRDRNLADAMVRFAEDHALDALGGRSA